ncbi:hypothetical protein Vadar_019506 [Vaccinium darrowii]|uniref:Uncharacterized protein n=1 Tax=Vaccinium darrowii TaxID=229202 RepID=A0ACB7Z5V7_9ERIC|nr:hypothetical protein Vadar_019506 [Vaccinium darrowii]
MSFEETENSELELPFALKHTPIKLGSSTCVNSCLARIGTITLSNEDLLLGATQHNRALFVTRYVGEQRVNRILLDRGSAVNILPLSCKESALKGLTLLVRDLNKTKVAPPLKGFGRVTNIPLVGNDYLPSQRTNGFDPNAYKLLAKAGHNSRDSTTLGKLLPEVTGEKIHGLNSTQKMLKQQGYAIKHSKVGLGYIPPTPTHIFIKRSNNNHITAEEVDSSISQKVFVFDRLSAPKLQASIFDRLAPPSKVASPSNTKKSIQSRLGQPSESSTLSENSCQSIQSRLRGRSRRACNDIQAEEDAEDAPPELEEEHVPRVENRQADALAKLASALALLDQETQVPICQHWVIPPIFDDEDNGEDEVNAISILEIDIEDWRQPLIDYPQDGKLPDDPHKRTDVKRRAPRFIYYKETLYRRSVYAMVEGENGSRGSPEGE